MNTDKIRHYYNETREFEFIRLSLYPNEFKITLNAILERTYKDDLILDAPCGFGQYTIELLKSERQVFANDLTYTLQNIKELETHYSSRLLGFTSYDVEDQFAWQSWPSVNSILLLGPFAHIQTASSRCQVLTLAKNKLKETTNLIKKNQYIFVSYLSIESAILYALEHYPHLIKSPSFKSCNDPLKDFSWSIPSGSDELVPWFFATPFDIASDFKGANIELECIYGLEGLLGRFIHLARELPDKELSSSWLTFAEKSSAHPGAKWCSEHLLAIGKISSSQ